MIHFKSVQKLLCDLFTTAYIARNSRDFYNFALKVSYIHLINKRFNVASSNYWSSTSNASNTSDAWNVNFNNGNDNWNTKTASNYVRCVRPADNNTRKFIV